jgi:7-cyano-7-deazaguanine synthase
MRDQVVSRGVGNEKGDALVLMSGGIDSAACAHLLISQAFKVSAVFVDYGQAASTSELRAANSMAGHLDIPLKVVKVAYSKGFTTGELVGRNAFLAFTAFFLLGAPKGLIAMGIHSGTPYYDCSNNFVEKMTTLFAEHTDGSTRFIAPFVDWSKRDIFDYSLKFSIPITQTYSCESGTTPPCGICASCADRRTLGC